jgi:hypothetical protein
MRGLGKKNPDAGSGFKISAKRERRRYSETFAMCAWLRLASVWFLIF